MLCYYIIMLDAVAWNAYRVYFSIIALLSSQLYSTDYFFRAYCGDHKTYRRWRQNEGKYIQYSRIFSIAFDAFLPLYIAKGARWCHVNYACHLNPLEM